MAQAPRTWILTSSPESRAAAGGPAGEVQPRTVSDPGAERLSDRLRAAGGVTA